MKKLSFFFALFCSSLLLAPPKNRTLDQDTDHTTVFVHEPAKKDNNECKCCTSCSECLVIAASFMAYAEINARFLGMPSPAQELLNALQQKME
jgi:hypothetical protein